METNIENYYKNPKLYISQSSIPNAGLGVFTKEDLQPGEILEHCHYLICNDSHLFPGNPLMHYRFKFKKFKHAIVWGYGSMFNTMEKKFNANWVNPLDGLEWELPFKNKKGEITRTLKMSRDFQDCYTYYVTHPIKKGEEIFLGYKLLKKI